MISNDSYDFLMPKFCLLRSHSPSIFDEFCKISPGFIIYLQKLTQKINENFEVLGSN